MLLRPTCMWRYDEHGLVSRMTALDSGVSSLEFDAAVRDAVLVRVERGVYIDGAVLDGEPAYRQAQIKYRARCIAVATRRDGDRLLSHLSAAALHGLPVLHPDRRFVHTMSGTRSGGVVRRRTTVVHTGVVPEDQIVEIDGVRTTCLARTAADLARVVGFAEALAVLDSALRLGATRDDLTEQLKARCHGAVRARYALRHADGRAANPGESWSRAQMIEAGLPIPELQVVYVLDDGSEAIVDFDWDGKVVGEFDGVVKYSGDYSGPGEAPADVVVAEKVREDALRDLGLDVGRWIYRELREHTMVGRLRERLSRNGFRVDERRSAPLDG